MKIPAKIRPYQEAFFRLLYPARCGACQSRLEINESGICARCEGHLTSLQLDLETSCLDLKFHFLRQAWALFPYETPVKEILSGVKFHGRRWLLKIFSDALERLSSVLKEEHYDWIVPIPLDPRRLVERQFNQSEIIARLLCQFLERPVVPALTKRIWTQPQSRLHQEDRRVNLHYVFSAARDVRGKKILIVDDVLTTGATADEAARVLTRNGAVHVDLAAIACSQKDLPITFQNSSYDPAF